MSERRGAATAVLVLATAIWGFSFTAMKSALNEIPPFEFLTLRSLVAFLAVALIWRRDFFRGSWSDVRMGAGPGIFITLGLGLQVVGLQYTTATKSGFITGLYVVFTPIVVALLFKSAPPASTLAGVLFATAGLALISFQPGDSASAATKDAFSGVNAGDLLTLLCALAFGIQIALLGRFAQRADYKTLSAVQLGFHVLVFATLALTVERLVVPAGWNVWFAILLTGLGATGFGVVAQTWAQARIPPVQTAIMFTLEPVFAGLTAFVLLGERLSVAGWVGAGLILLGIFATGVRAPDGPRRQRAADPRTTGSGAS